MIKQKHKYETTGRMLKSKLSRTDRWTFRPRFRWEMLIHIWISPNHWKDASEEKRSLESDILYVFLSLGTQVYKYIYVIVDHWFFWVTGWSNHRENDALLDSLQKYS